MFLRLTRIWGSIEVLCSEPHELLTKHWATQLQALELVELRLVQEDAEVLQERRGLAGLGMHLCSQLWSDSTAQTSRFDNEIVTQTAVLNQHHQAPPTHKHTCWNFCMVAGVRRMPFGALAATFAASEYWAFWGEYKVDLETNTYQKFLLYTRFAQLTDGDTLTTPICQGNKQLIRQCWHSLWRACWTSWRRAPQLQPGCCVWPYAGRGRSFGARWRCTGWCSPRPHSHSAPVGWHCYSLLNNYHQDYFKTLQCIF